MNEMLVLLNFSVCKIPNGVHQIDMNRILRAKIFPKSKRHSRLNIFVGNKFNKLPGEELWFKFKVL